jgi:hypothetical protein
MLKPTVEKHWASNYVHPIVTIDFNVAMLLRTVEIALVEKHGDQCIISAPEDCETVHH